MAERHVLGISGGRDSAALAVFVRQTRPELDVDYFFTDTGKELPEVIRVFRQAGRLPGKAHRALEPETQLRFLAARIQSFFAFSADPLVHAAAQTRPLRAVDSAHARSR